MLQVSDLTRVGDVLWVSGVLQVSYMPRLSNVSYASDAAGRIYVRDMHAAVCEVVAFNEPRSPRPNVPRSLQRPTYRRRSPMCKRRCRSTNSVHKRFP